MAIGDTGNASGKIFENTYYSRLKFRNSTNDKISLNVSFRSGLMIFDICNLVDGKYESLQAVHLSPTKAKLLSKEIDNFVEYFNEVQKNPKKYIPGKAFGVNAGMAEKVSYIGFYINEDMKMAIIIGKFDTNGVIIESASTVLNCSEYHFSLEWEDIHTNKLQKCFHDEIEIEQLKEVCEDFGRYMNGVIGYSVADITKFDLARVLKKMDPIYDKLGIERKTYGNSGYQRGNNSFLSSGSSGGFNQSSMNLPQSSSNSSQHMSYSNMEEQFFGGDEDEM